MMKLPKRDVHGIVLLNKPVGISSNAALQRVKQLFQARKAGHTGSLDNQASGLLPICLGEATKLAGFLLDADKRYRAECTLGTTTTTGDVEGEIVKIRPVVDVDTSRLQQVFHQFTGEIQQIPPMYSALKYQGQALYTLARQGKTVERAPRAVTIYQIQLLDWQGKYLTLEIHCSKGTYIRTLAEDIGEALGCGAHVSALHRLTVGSFCDMHDYATLECYAQQGLLQLDSVLIPMHTALNHLPSVYLTTEQVKAIGYGQSIHLAHTLASGVVSLFAQDSTSSTTAFLGIGDVLADGRIAPKRLLKQDWQS